MQNQILKMVIIPDNVEFSDLKLARSADGAVSFDWGPIEKICQSSGIDVSLLRDQHEDNVAGLLMQWYRAHRETGGEPDPVAEDLLAEVMAENAAGQNFSLPPGRA